MLESIRSKIAARVHRLLPARAVSHGIRMAPPPSNSRLSRRRFWG